MTRKQSMNTTVEITNRRGDQSRYHCDRNYYWNHELPFLTEEQQEYLNSRYQRGAFHLNVGAEEEDVGKDK